MKNIVLIGMMGSGKTTLGKMLSIHLDMDFVDMDEYIQKKESKSITEIFETHGESYFRDLEYKYAKELSLKENLVIACGGGIIKTIQAIDALANGLIIFIDRPADQIYKDIDFDSRPLIKQDPQVFFDIFNERYEIYKKFAMHTINNNAGKKEALLELIKIAKEGEL